MRISTNVKDDRGSRAIGTRIAEDVYNQVSSLPENSPARAAALIQVVSARQARDSAARSLSWYTGHPTEIQQALLDAEVMWRELMGDEDEEG